MCIIPLKIRGGIRTVIIDDKWFMYAMMYNSVLGMLQNLFHSTLHSLS